MVVEVGGFGGVVRSCAELCGLMSAELRGEVAEADVVNFTSHLCHRVSFTFTH